MGWEVLGCIAEPPAGLSGDTPGATGGQRRAGDAVTAPCAPTPPAWFQRGF